MKVSIMNENVVPFKEACKRNDVEFTELSTDGDFTYFGFEEEDQLTFRLGVDYGIMMMTKNLVESAKP